MRHVSLESEQKSIADLQASEPTVEWKDVFRGNRIEHRFYPYQYARIVIARRTRSAFSPNDTFPEDA